MAAMNPGLNFLLCFWVLSRSERSLPAWEIPSASWRQPVVCAGLQQALSGQGGGLCDPVRGHPLTVSNDFPQGQEGSLQGSQEVI